MLEAVPPYIKAIIAANNTAFPRLECPAPSGNLYAQLPAIDPERDLSVLRFMMDNFFATDLHQSLKVLP